MLFDTIQRNYAGNRDTIARRDVNRYAPLHVATTPSCRVVSGLVEVDKQIGASRLPAEQRLSACA